ncbi:9101_t:CDS:2, partial [Gigaspora margarita]
MDFVTKERQCAITMCIKAPYQPMKSITDTLPVYLKVGDVICQRCYNGVIIKPSTSMKEHAWATNIQILDVEEHAIVDQEEASEVITFSKAIKIMTDILYQHEVVQKLPAFKTFEEFRD